MALAPGFQDIDHRPQALLVVTDFAALSGGLAQRNPPTTLNVDGKEVGYAALTHPAISTPLLRLGGRLERLPVEFLGKRQPFLLGEAVIGKVEQRVLAQRHDERA